MILLVEVYIKLFVMSEANFPEIFSQHTKEEITKSELQTN